MQLDIVIVDSKNNQIYILLGDGNGTFPTITTYDAVSGSSPFWIAVADFNNDNQSDIVVVDYGTNDIRPLIGYSDKPSARVRLSYWDTGYYRLQLLLVILTTIIFLI